jgi:moderate conductance mechanosensitive channel
LTASPTTLVLAAAAALVAAYLVADIVARFVQSTLRAIIEDQQVEELFVDRPRRIVRLAIFLITAIALLLPALRLAGVQTSVGTSPAELARWASKQGLAIVLIAVGGYLAIRIGSAATRRFERQMSTGTGLDVIERTKRAQTLSRLIQKTLSIVVTVVAGLMILRELDIDITPVLTGAGIVGLAVGFGAQTLVRDVISGFFLILEDQVRVGDVAVVNGQGGLVEEVNLRTMVLRDEEGTVHVFPNGEVKTLANKSKDFSYFVITVPIPLETDPDAVASAINDAAATLQADDAFKPHILEPFELYGMDGLEPGQFFMKGRIKTVPLKQWTVGRELRARIARTLKARGIDLPKPTMHVYMETPLSLNTPASDRNL